MIDVNKYKLDDDSNEEDNLDVSQTFKANKDEIKTSIDNVYNNNYKRNNLELIEKKNVNNQTINENQVKDGNNKYPNNKTYKYLVDESISKTHNEYSQEQNNIDLINNINHKNFLAQSNNDDKLGSTNDKNKFGRNENNDLNCNNQYKNCLKRNNQNETSNDDFLNNINSPIYVKQDICNHKNNSDKNRKDSGDKFLELQNFNNCKDDDEDFFNKKANFHHVQIIDEDVENFRRKIDILVKNFKTDSLKDFMSIKRHLLIEQKNAIEAEKQKCDSLVGAKTDQIEHLKENLDRTRNALNKEIEIKEKFSLHYYNYRTNKKNQNLKKNIFEAIKKNFIKKKTNKRVYTNYKPNYYFIISNNLKFFRIQ